jgi:hypothetical protein
MKPGAVSLSLAIAVTLLALGASAAEKPEDKPPSSVDQIRIGFGGGYVRGSEIVGAGTRKPYARGYGVMDIGVRSFTHDGIGIEADFDLVPANYGGSLGTPFVRVDLGALWAPLRVDPARLGDSGGSLALGVGGGLVGGERYWTDKFRMYPLLLARGRVLWGDGWAIDVGANFAPIDTSKNASRFVREARTELALSYGLVQFALQWGHFWVVGGDPVRTYPENDFFAMIGVVLR